MRKVCIFERIHGLFEQNFDDFQNFKTTESGNCAVECNSNDDISWEYNFHLYCKLFAKQTQKFFIFGKTRKLERKSMNSNWFSSSQKASLTNLGSAKMPVVGDRPIEYPFKNENRQLRQRWQKYSSWWQKIVTEFSFWIFLLLSLLLLRSKSLVLLP